MILLWMNSCSACVSRAAALAAALHGAKVAHGDVAVHEFGGEHVRCRDGVLNREIDADAADRRHRVRRVADAEQARRYHSAGGSRAPSAA